ncbi:MAG: response regulator transcription factor [Chitinophaga sp.]|uniref:LytR/AlgR family response regulator transcription factor n=1 Tax=Chitinophaga sp. TaxID=1869181 RepID=UPI001B2E508A|nr:LytTR family DNA-binding domain-containing protein [Chitinophaga sp.]MBO9728959.1 response regulator transcription factor [Chitinophaga sp.]
MRIVIIEDENLAIKRLSKLLIDTEKELQIEATLKSIVESVQWFKENPAPDLIFMDIELADGQSFEIFHQITIKCPIIFTTSYDQYALKAFEVNSIDYLLKPIEPADLQRSLDKYVQIKKLYAGQVTSPIDVTRLLSDLQQKIGPKYYRSRFLVKSGAKMVSIETTEIAYFFREGRITFFKTFENRKFIADYTLDKIEEMLEPGSFFRINRSCLVATRSIQTVELFFGNRLELQLMPSFDGDAVVSRDKAGEFKEWMGK